MCVYIHILYIYIYIIFMCVIHHSHSFLILFFSKFHMPIPQRTSISPSSIHLPSFQAIRHGQDSRLPHPGGWAFDQESSTGRWCSDPCPVKSLDNARDDQVDKWAQQEPSARHVTWCPHYDKESLSLKNWNIFEPESSINLLPSLHKESWCCKLPKMQRPSAATTLCKLFPSLVASEGTRTATANGLNSDTVILTDRRFPRKKPYLMRKKTLFPADFSSNHTNCIQLHSATSSRQSSSFGGLCHSLKTSSPAKNNKLMVTKMASKGHHPKMVWHFSYLLNRFASPKL